MPAEWYRTPDCDQAAKTEFSHRYNRARRPHRVQYKVIKATHLMEAGEPGAINWTEELLTEVTLDNEIACAASPAEMKRLQKLARCTFAR